MREGSASSRGRWSSLDAPHCRDVFGLLLLDAVDVARVAVDALHQPVLWSAGELLCAVCFRSVGRVSQLMCWAPLRWLGNMSYSYYLVHGFIVRLSMTALAQVVTGALPPVAFWLLIVPLFAATLAGSALLFVGVEKPVSLR